MAAQDLGALTQSGPKSGKTLMKKHFQLGIFESQKLNGDCIKS